MRTRQRVSARNKHRKVLRQAKGMQHGHRRSYRAAKQAIIKALRYAYRDRRARKRDFRRLWITRINNAVREHDMNYSQFMEALKKHDLRLDRKILSELAVNEPRAFSKLVDLVKTKVAKPKNT